MSEAVKTLGAALGCGMLLAAISISVDGCDKPEAMIGSYPVVVRALDDSGNPLPGLQLTASGRPLGATETSGERLLALRGTEGDRVTLGASCPNGYEGPRERAVLLLKRVVSLQGKAAQPIELNLTCDAKEHVAMVAIRAGRPGIPIQLRGQPVAQTSAAGTAHVFLREPVGNSFKLTLDTSGNDALRPESPTRMFSISSRDGFTVWDQPFEEEKHKPKKRLKRKRDVEPAIPEPSPPPKHIPERIR